VHRSHHIELVTKTFVHLCKRVLTMVTALALVRFSNKMKRLSSCYAQFQNIVFPVFENKATRSSLVLSAYNLSIPRFVTFRSFCYFWKVETASQRCS